MANTIPGFGDGFIANLPIVPQKSFHGDGKVNTLEILKAIVVPPNTFLPVPNHPNG